MAARKPKVIVTRRLPDPVETRMRELFDTELNLDDTPMDREALVKALARADAIVPTITDRIDAELIAEAGSQLKLIANFGAGVDHIDVAAATERGIAVTNTPGVLTEDTADLTMALIMAVSRRIVEGANVVQAGEFTGWTPTWMMGRRVNGKRLGIIGMGRIGRQVARRAAAFDMRILYCNRRRDPEAEEQLGVTYAPLAELLAESDFVTLNCPLTPETNRLIGAAQLAQMKRSAILINMARGGVVDTQALYEALASGTIAAAGLDVTEPEPLPRDHPLLLLKNVVIAPHLGSATNRTRQRMMERTVENLRAGLRGEPLPYQIRPTGT